MAEGQRGHGIGKMLVASAAKAGQQFGNSTVALAALDNGSGHLTRWYREMGFTSIGVNQRGYPRLEAPISRILTPTAQRKMQSQGTDRICVWTAPKAAIVNGAAEHAWPRTPRANPTPMLEVALVPPTFGTVLQRMKASGYCQSCGRPVLSSTTGTCPSCRGNIGPNDPRDPPFDTYDLHDAKTKGQIFDRSILNLNCGRYCATSAIKFWFPGITEDVLKGLLPKPESSVFGVGYAWSPGSEGAAYFQRLEKIPKTLEQWLEQLKRWGPQIVGGAFANVLNITHVGHFVLVVGIVAPTAKQEGKIVVQDSFTTRSEGARIEWSFGKFQKTVKSAYRVNKLKIELNNKLNRRELPKPKEPRRWIVNPLYEPPR